MDPDPQRCLQLLLSAAELVTFLCEDTVRPGFCVLSILFHLFTLLTMTYYDTFV